jgi:hypothetical protein
MNWLKWRLSALVAYIKRGASEAHRWVLGGNTVWLVLLLAAAIFIVFYLMPFALDKRVRWAGTLIELIGVTAVWISIERARFLFGKSSVFRGALTWLGEVRFIFIRRPTVNLSASAFLGLGTSIATAVVRAHCQPKTAEERIDQLEKEMKGLRDSFEKVKQKIDQQKQELQAQIDREAAARQAADQGVSKKVEEGLIGDSPLELAGVFYVCLGLLMAHLSEEVAHFLTWFGLS